jgi:hypothetical protein
MNSAFVHNVRTFFLVYLGSIVLSVSNLQASIFEKVADNVMVQVAQLNGGESKNYLGADYLKLGYQPMLLTIKNNSGDELLLRGSAIQLPLQTRSEMAQLAHYDTFFWTTTTGYAAFLFFWPALVPVAIGGSYMAWSNNTVSRKVYMSVLEYADACEILPYDHLERILFVNQSQLTNSFFMYLYNVNKKQFVPFSVSFTA